MLQSRLALPLAALLLAAGAAFAVSRPPVVARVNGKPILRSELEQERNRLEAAGEKNPEKAALQKLIEMQLALQRAKETGLDDDPSVRSAMNQVLYRSFIDSRLAAARITLEPTERELEHHYAQEPLLRLRHLVLPAETPAELQEARLTSALIRKRLQEGVEFKKLVLQYSQDESVRTAGDLDYRGVHALPGALYRTGLALDVGQVSADIVTEEGLHLVQLLGRKPFAEAPAPYREMLRGRLRAQREERFLSTVFEELRKNAKVEIAKGVGHP